MDDWFEIIIFIIVIIANIVGAVFKKRQKKAKEKTLALPDYTDNSAEFEEDEEYAFDEYENQKAAEDSYISNVQNIPFPSTTAANAPCIKCPPEKEDNFCPAQEMQVEDIDSEDNDTFDYGEFMRKQGREAFILAEIILPPNSRQSS